MISSIREGLPKKHASVGETRPLLSRAATSEAADEYRKGKPPSYFRRMFGVAHVAPYLPYVPEAPKAQVAMTLQNHVNHYFDREFGCRPEEYRVGMKRRFTPTLHNCVLSRRSCISDLDDLILSNPSVAFGLLKQLLKPPAKKYGDLVRTTENLKASTIPKIQTLSTGARIAADTARDVVESLEYMERIIFHKDPVQIEVKRLKETFLEYTKDKKWDLQAAHPPEETLPT